MPILTRHPRRTRCAWEKVSVGITSQRTHGGFQGARNGAGPLGGLFVIAWIPGRLSWSAAVRNARSTTFDVTASRASVDGELLKCDCGFLSGRVSREKGNLEQTLSQRQGSSLLNHPATKPSLVPRVIVRLREDYCFNVCFIAMKLRRFDGGVNKPTVKLLNDIK